MKNTWKFDKTYAMSVIETYIKDNQLRCLHDSSELLINYIDKNIQYHASQFKSLVSLIEYIYNEPISEQQINLLYQNCISYFGYNHDIDKYDNLSNYIFTSYEFKFIIKPYYDKYKYGSHTKFIFLKNKKYGVLSTSDTLKPKVFKNNLLKIRTKNFGNNLYAVYNKTFLTFDDVNRDTHYDELLCSVQNLIPEITTSNYSETRKPGHNVNEEMLKILDYLNSPNASIEHRNKLLDIFKTSYKMLKLALEDSVDKIVQYDFRRVNFYKDERRKTIVPYDVWFCS